jgi:broad specificity phosphatase PhoE
MTLVWLVRHGMTDAVGHRLSGRLPGFPLSQYGRAQVARLSERLGRARLAAVYTSPLERALETARAIALRHELRPIIRPALTDIDFGAWNGLSYLELETVPAWRTFNAYRSGVRPPGGEHVSEVQMRMVSELECLRQEHPSDCIAIVSHADPLRTAIGFYLGVTIDLQHRLAVDPASLTLLELNSEGARLRLLNDTSTVSLERFDA